jgi:hypothetical protein
MIRMKTIRFAMRRNAATLSLIAAGLLALPMVFAAPPKPNEAQVDWQINIDYKTPQPIMIKVPGQTKPQLYWYTLFTVTNRTGRDRDFHPEILLYTNTGQMLRAGAGVNPAVYDQIKKMHNSPLLRDLVGMNGKLLQGQDNAKEGVAIFRDFDPKAGSFDIFFGGLSGETVIIKLPKPVKVKEIGPDGKEKTVTTDKISLIKTLQLKYAFGTESADRANAKVEFVSQDWIMR